MTKILAHASDIGRGGALAAGDARYSDLEQRTEIRRHQDAYDMSAPRSA
ncbi:hypothetical protein [Streptomyces sp. NPDC088358]